MDLDIIPAEAAARVCPRCYVVKREATAGWVCPECGHLDEVETVPYPDVEQDGIVDFMPRASA